MGLEENLARVQERIDRAARRAGRDPATIRLVAVTKGRDLATVRALVALGLVDLGENRVQEALGKVAGAPAAARWHWIGHLQENKINKILPWVYLLQSLDSLDLARSLDKRAQRAGRRLSVLLEVKTAPEATKHGFAPEAVADVQGALAVLPGLEVQGVMTIAPLTQDAALLRRSFGLARRALERVAAVAPAAQILSMGMSDDLEIAVEEGATMLRIGRALVEA